MPTSLLRHLLPLCLGLASAGAATQTSDIQGLLQTSAAASTDTLVSPAFGRAPVWAGAVASVSGSHLAVNGSPGWTTDQFAPGTSTYYVRVLSGSLAGHFLSIAGNDAASVLVDAAGLDLSTVVAGDRLELAPYWTLGTLYPAANAGVSFIASTSSLVRQTELYVYDAAGTGTNRSPSATYYFFNGAWRKVGSPASTSFDRTVIAPDAYFIQRNKAAATKLTTVGRVQPGQVATVLEARSGGAQDNFVAVPYPLGLTLRQLGLAGTAAFTTSGSTLVRADEIYVFDASATGINRAPSATYYYYNGGWRKVGDSAANDYSDSVTLAAGGGFIVRRAADETSASWAFDTTL